MRRSPPPSWRRCTPPALRRTRRSEEHTSELQSRSDLVCRLLLEKKKKKQAHPQRCAAHPDPHMSGAQVKCSNGYLGFSDVTRDDSGDLVQHIATALIGKQL